MPAGKQEIDVAVFVLDKNGKALMPCAEKRARLLLERGRAHVHRVVPFVIRLVDRQAATCEFQPLRLKLNPGSKVTGLALVRDAEGGAAVLNLFELAHRGRQISEALTARRNMRRRRRGANLRYRAPRFLNRGNKGKGWLAPSLQHRVVTVLTWVKRLTRWAPVSAGTMLHRFAPQALENPEIEGVEYQQGKLAGYEVREYLLEKWGRKCAYCGAEHTPLQVEHIHPKARGGSNRVSNLTLSCHACNQAKGAQDVREFLAHQQERLKRILAQAKAPLKDAAAVNSTRWALLNELRATGLPVEISSGGRIKWNRAQFGIPKAHALDAACAGAVQTVEGWQRPTLTIKAMGRGSYARTRLDRFGFPRGVLTRQKRHFGFQTGDRVVATVPKGKKAGIHAGRVAVRTSGSFNIQTAQGIVQSIGHKYCRLVQRGDGYGYSFIAQQRKESENRGRVAHAALSLPGLNAGVSRIN